MNSILYSVLHTCFNQDCLSIIIVIKPAIKIGLPQIGYCLNSIFPLIPVLCILLAILLIKPPYNKAPDPFELPIDDFRNLKLEELKFIYEQSEKRLKDAKDSDHLIQVRTAGFMTAIVALLVVIFNMIISKWTSDIKLIIANKIIFTIVFLLCSSLLWALYYLINNFSHRSYHYVGNSPKWYWETIKKSDNMDIRKEMIIDDLKYYQTRIESFWKNYDRRYHNFNFAVKILQMVFKATVMIIVFACYLMLVSVYPQLDIFNK